MSEVVQATGRVATSLIDGLKAQPAMLLVLILNVLMFGLIAWGADRNNARREKRDLLMLERCLPRLAPSQGSDMIGPRLDGTVGGSVADRS